MADIKVSEMTEATTFDDNDYTMIVQANQSKKIAKTNMFNDINTNIGDMTSLETTDKSSLVNAINEIKNSKNYLVQSFSNASCTQNTSNNLAGLTLSKGIWVVVGNFDYSGNVLRYYMSLALSNNLEVAHSCYDNAGVVAGNIVAIVNSEGNQNIVLSLWPTDKNVIVSGKLKAVKYQ